MKDLLELRDWLTVSEACKYLSNHGINATEADIYDLALELKLKLSVDFLEEVWVENLKTRKIEKAIGQFDLPMTGNEWFEVEKECAKASGRKIHDIPEEAPLQIELQRDGEDYVLLCEINNTESESGNSTCLDAPPFLCGRLQYVIRKTELDRIIKEKISSEPAETIDEIEELKARISELEQENKQLKASLEELSKEPDENELMPYYLLTAWFLLKRRAVHIEKDHVNGLKFQFDGLENIADDINRLKVIGTLNEKRGITKIRDAVKKAFDVVVIRENFKKNLESGIK